jgi:hypothetical protein
LASTISATARISAATAVAAFAFLAADLGSTAQAAISSAATLIAAAIAAATTALGGKIGDA